jgi:hypothetical protein
VSEEAYMLAVLVERPDGSVVRRVWRGRSITVAGRVVGVGLIDAGDRALGSKASASGSATRSPCGSRKPKVRRAADRSERSPG